MKPDLWVIIPVKPFALGKSRLSGVMDAQSRAALSRRLFDHVFDAAVAAIGAGRVAVVTPDAALSAAIEARAAHGVVSGGDLNAALGDACRFTTSHGAQAIMVLPSDLPYLSKDNISALVSALPPAPGVVIAPDAAEKPPTPWRYRLPTRLLPLRAIELRRSRRIRPRTRRNDRDREAAGLAFDLDTPDDYRSFVARSPERIPF